MPSFPAVAASTASTNRTIWMYVPALIQTDFIFAFLIFEQSLKPKYPIYETINIQVKGYDYAVLENYQKFLHRIAESMDLEIADRFVVYDVLLLCKRLHFIHFHSWATPPQHYQIQRMKPASAVIDTEYKLTMYDRTIQVGSI